MYTNKAIILPAVLLYINLYSDINLSAMHPRHHCDNGLSSKMLEMKEGRLIEIFVKQALYWPVCINTNTLTSQVVLCDVAQH